MSFEDTAIYILLGMVIGAGVVGASVQRTISVARGDMMGAINSSVVNSIAYFYSVYFIAKDNITAYVGTVIGSTIVVIWLTIRNRKNKNEDKD